MENLQNQIRWLLQEKYGGQPTRKATAAKAKKDIQRLNNAEPLDYIIGFMEFLGCKIDLSKKPLIPRVETEYWTEKAIEEIHHNFHSCENCEIGVLDMFAGSGAIGIAVLKHISGAHVTFADSEKNCIEQIKINAKINKLQKEQYAVIRSNVFENIQGQFDVIFANPPYIPTKRKSKVQRSVIKHEPKAALFGGEEGLLYIQQFLGQAKSFLKPAGRIYMEFDSPQKPKITKLIKKFRYSGHEFQKDQYGKWRYVVILK